MDRPFCFRDVRVVGLVRAADERRDVGAVARGLFFFLACRCCCQRYDGDEAFYAPGEAALDAPDGDDGVVEEPASSPKVIEDRDAWLQSLAARAGDQEAPATPTAAAAAAAPTPESSNARSFFEGLLNSPGK